MKREVKPKKCVSCHAVQPAKEFYRRGRYQATCHRCADKARARYNAKLAAQVAEGQKRCAKCKCVKAADEFKRVDGRTRQTCNACAEKVSLRDAKNKGEMIDGRIHKLCPICQQMRPRELFKSGKSYVANCCFCRGKQKAKQTEVKTVSLYQGWSELVFDGVGPCDPLVDPFTNFASPEWRVA